MIEQLSKNDPLRKIFSAADLFKMASKPFVLIEFFSHETTSHLYLSYGKFPAQLDIKLHGDSVVIRSEFQPVFEDWKYGEYVTQSMLKHEDTNSVNFRMRDWRNFRWQNLAMHMSENEAFCRLIYGEDEVLKFIGHIKTMVSIEKDKELNFRWKVVSELHDRAAPKLGFLAPEFHVRTQAVVTH